MKNGIPQIVVGILIILVSVYITGWMIHEAPDTLTQPAPDYIGGVEFVDVEPENAVLFDIGRYSSWLLPLLGIVIAIAGALQRNKPSARAIMIGGALTAVLGFFVAFWGFPTDFNVLQPGTGAVAGSLTLDPGKEYVLLRFFSFLVIPFGLVALALGLVQHSRADKESN